MATVALLVVAAALSLPALYSVGALLITSILLASALSVPKASTTSIQTAAVYGSLVGFVVGAIAATVIRGGVASAALIVLGMAATCGAITALVYALEKKFVRATSG